VGRGEDADAVAGGEPAGAADVGLEDVEGALGEQLAEAVVGALALAARDGDVDPVAQLAVAGDVLGGSGSSNQTAPCSSRTRAMATASGTV
jgi:hypothetical protein